MPGPRGERCETCYFFGAIELYSDTLPSDDRGRCRYQPPVIMPNDGGSIIGEQPTVSGEDDWCGCWTLRAETVTSGACNDQRK